MGHEIGTLLNVAHRRDAHRRAGNHSFGVGRAAVKRCGIAYEPSPGGCRMASE